MEQGIQPGSTVPLQAVKEVRNVIEAVCACMDIKRGIYVPASVDLINLLQIPIQAVAVRV